VLPPAIHEPAKTEKGSSGTYVPIRRPKRNFSETTLQTS
jgi:hypothetical protein